jgi:glycosyltransferase involved in cell wall biosynthesis
MQQKSIIFANDSWYILKFRKHLISRLVQSGRVLVVTGDMQYAQPLRDLGADVRTIPMSPRSTSPLRILQSCYHFAKLIRQEHPQYVLTFNPSAGLIAAIASRVTRMQQIATISGFGKYKFLFSRTPDTLKHKVLRFALEQFLVKWPEISVVQNAADFDYVRGVRGPEFRVVRVMGSGVDLSQFSFVERDFSHLRVLFASRFLLEKGILEYIALARTLENTDTVFSICGLPVENDDGLNNQELQEAITGTKIGFLGEVSDMATLLAETDVVVLPSLYGEGIPRILIEAAARGCLIVAHEIDGVREIVMDGHTGLLTKKPDFDGLLKAMTDLTNLPLEEKIQMSHAAHDLACSQFDLEDVTRTYTDIMSDGWSG